MTIQRAVTAIYKLSQHRMLEDQAKAIEADVDMIEDGEIEETDFEISHDTLDDWLDNGWDQRLKGHGAFKMLNGSQKVHIADAGEFLLFVEGW